MDRPAVFLSRHHAAELRLISHSGDLRLHGQEAPWAFIQPRGRCLATQRKICLALVILLCGATGLIALFSLRTASVTPLLHGLSALVGVAALFLGLAWNYRRELGKRRDGELAAAAIRREMARSPANDWLFALVYRDTSRDLELLAFFQEGTGAQRLETIRAPRVGDGDKHTETDVRVIRKALNDHFIAAQINDLNVVSIGRIGNSVEAEQRAQHHA